MVLLVGSTLSSRLRVPNQTSAKPIAVPIVAATSQLVGSPADCHVVRLSRPQPQSASCCW